MELGLLFMDLYEFPHLIVQSSAIKLIKLNQRKTFLLNLLNQYIICRFL